ncbi:DUF2254 domain-containing protein [Cellulomonas sp. APG4]|uniref:DUF2254 domain-containing protein n=1 Tax=Cellulomonas sp. APG4 TaxID=1538656 RepID=UPI00137A4146|nr:DUF2254 domain-containing protein [Cellulomonas sp. APG4]NCT92318.1 DUF2254 domain-containing protein [Cellulomonas sp. APG4]
MTMVHRARESFWFIPSLLCVAAVVLAEGLVALDRGLGGVDLPSWADVVLYRVGESGSRDVLGAIATSSLAVAGTTFSITIAVLALTSSSYGPRLVRNFMADRGNQTVLGVYVATFLYSLLVLRAIRTLDGDDGVFVPHLATNAAVLLAVANIGVLIWFIHHVSDSIQVSTISRRVRTELASTVDRMYPERLGVPAGGRGADDEERLATALRAGREVAAEDAGYVRFVREEALMAAARDGDVLVALLVRPGRYVIPGVPLAVVHPSHAASREVRDAVRGALEIGDTRTPAQDVEFAVQQLTELAVRALSPGTNDPTTAINALDDLSAGLARMAGRTPPDALRRDDDGVVRVHAPRPELPELVAPVLDAMRWYAAGAPAVMLATLDLVERVARSALDPSAREAVLAHVPALTTAFEAAGHDERDLRRWRTRADEVTRVGRSPYDTGETSSSTSTPDSSAAQ